MRSRFLAVLAIVAVVAFSLVVTGCAGGGSAGGDGLHKTAPDVVGLSQSEASARIVDAGYEVGSVSSEQSQQSEAGTVISQDPVAGTSLARGSEINLVVAGQ